MSASTDKLLSMGLHNTAEELIEGHLSSQKARLSRTKEGRKILVKIGWTALDAIPRAQIPDPWRQSIITRPLPRNMNPTHHEARRAARARNLNKNFGKDPKVIYTDASRPRGKPYATFCGINQEQPHSERNGQDHGHHRSGGDGRRRHTRLSPTQCKHIGTTNRVGSLY